MTFYQFVNYCFIDNFLFNSNASREFETSVIINFNLEELK